jgi:hypothetical protein
MRVVVVALVLVLGEVMARVELGVVVLVAMVDFQVQLTQAVEVVVE